MRPYVMSIAGVDPSSGAGVFADIKTFEQLKTYGLGVCTATTLQHESSVKDVRWEDDDWVMQQIELLVAHYDVKHFKIGVIKDLTFLRTIVQYLQKEISDPVIVWDPVMTATSGYDFHKAWDYRLLKEVLSHVTLITPNTDELTRLYDDHESVAIEFLREHTNLIITGGHAESKEAIDVLYTKDDIQRFPSPRMVGYDKHGSGCVFSSAIAGYMAKGFTLREALIGAKKYINQFIKSEKGLIGYHCI